MILSQPIEQLRAIYRENGREKTFDQDLVEHLRDGLVIATPQNLVMGRLVQLDDGRHAWSVAAAAGDLRELVLAALRLYPVHPPFVLFCRHGQSKGRLYPTLTFFRRILHAT